MPYGNFYYGKAGFFYKKSGATGARYNPSLAAICNQPQDVNNRYVPGAGVGASSTAQRRAMLINAYRTVPQGCGEGPQRLGIFAKGGSNACALNWGLYGGCIPTLINLKQIGGTSNSVIISFVNSPNYRLRFTNYQYSFDGVNFISFNPAQISSPVTISGLTVDTDYTIYLRAMNGFVAGPTSAGLQVTTRPLAPTTLQLVSSNNSNSVTINFVQPNGVTISTYQYSIGGGSFANVTSYDAVNSAVTITNVALQTGNIYTITLRAISSPGLVAGNTSNPITVLVGAYQSSGLSPPYSTMLTGSANFIMPNSAIITISATPTKWYINSNGGLLNTVTNNVVYYQQLSQSTSDQGGYINVFFNNSDGYPGVFAPQDAGNNYYFYIPSSP
jgi:hypothetical protein